MNRRRFLTMLGIAPVVAKAAPLLKVIGRPIDPLLGVPIPEGAVIGSYCEYVNFSNLAIATALDEVVEKAALELSRNNAQRINALYQTVAFGRA